MLGSCETVYIKSIGPGEDEVQWCRVLLGRGGAGTIRQVAAEAINSANAEPEAPIPSPQIQTFLKKTQKILTAIEKAVRDDFVKESATALSFHYAMMGMGLSGAFVTVFVPAEAPTPQNFPHAAGEFAIVTIDARDLKFSVSPLQYFDGDIMGDCAVCQETFDYPMCVTCREKNNIPLHHKSFKCKSVYVAGSPCQDCEMALSSPATYCGRSYCDCNNHEARPRKRARR